MMHEFLGRLPLKNPRLVIVVVALMLICLALVQSYRYKLSSLPVANDLQSALWKTYLQSYWQNGRTFDPANHGYTTSEAQGYTMLRAMWQNDQQVFNSTWSWTAAHLRRSDQLFGWLWGSGGFVSSQGGQNTASDADTDIALSLVLADGRWHDPADLSAAKKIIPAIWNNEVVDIKGVYYLTADQLEPKSSRPIINPSYFEPYAYEIFAKLDPTHPWGQLASDSYQTLLQASQQQLGSKSSDNLPPDWVAINRQTGQLQPAPGKDTNFGFDAFRSVWRTALDFVWNHDATAKNALASFSALTDDWNHQNKLFAIYRHDGQPAVNYSSIALYGGTLGYFLVIHPQIAGRIFQSKLASLYNSTTHQLKTNLNYYDNNWAWFGAALYGHSLVEYLPNGVGL